MSKKSARQNVYYNRQSKGWQQNQMKKQMTEAGYSKGLPKPLDGKKMRIVVIIGAVLLLALTVLLIIKLHWTGFFIGLGLIIAATAGVVFYLRKRENDILKAYKAMGMPKAEFFKQLKKNSKQPLTKKQLDKMGKTWDKL